MLEFITSQKGYRKLVISGFIFTKNSIGSDGKELWRCEIKTCHARAHTRDEKIIRELGYHNHAVTHGRVEVEATRCSMKRRAETTEEGTRSIVQNELLNIPGNLAHLIPRRETLSRDVRRHRQKAGPNDQDIGAYSHTQSGQPFIRTQNETMLIFAADDDLDFLSRSEHWFADGTFRVSPSEFDQLYTVHGFLNGEVFPAVYVLLNGRTIDIYKRFLDEILHLNPNLNPRSIVVDFELAAIRAFQDIFQGATVNGCMFHFGQCVWRKLQSEGLSGRYRDDVDFATRVKCLLGLAFVPVAEVIAAYETLIADPEFRDIDVICDYMEDNFIGRERRGVRGEPRFAIQLWNQYSRVVQNLPRSNNSLEGWHNAFNNVVGFAHPTPAKLARKLQQEQHSSQLNRRQMELGVPAAKKKKLYIRINEALRTMVADYINRDQVSYLRDIARVLNINVV